MEKTILLNLFSGLFAITSILVVVILEKILFRKKVNETELERYQAELDEESRSLFRHFGIERRFDAWQEIKRERRQRKIFVHLNFIAVYLSVLILIMFMEPTDIKMKYSLMAGILIFLFFAIFNGFRKD